MASVSTDGGHTWGKNVLVYQSPDGNVCECCHPSVTFDRGGQIYVQWRNSLGGARDMYYAVSTDVGKTFGLATKLGNGTWPLKACPMDGGAIAAVSGKLATTWRRESSVYLQLSSERDEQLLGPGEQPWLTATDQGEYIVWLRKRGDALILSAPDSKSATVLAPRAWDPVIVTAPAGRGPVVAAWESRDGQQNYTINVQVIAG
jgi:hypothetical protein